MIVKLIQMDVAANTAVKLEYTPAGSKRVAGYLVASNADRVEFSLYQDNRSTALIRKVEHGGSVTIAGTEVKAKKCYNKLNTQSNGKITGVVKNLDSSTKRIGVYLEVE